MGARFAERQLQQQIRAGGELVTLFQQHVVSARAKNEVADVRGDATVIKSLALPPAKRLPACLLKDNYLFLYLSYHLCPSDQEARKEFLEAKQERQRFTQWQAPIGCTLTQVTPATHMFRSREHIIETALGNIFSVTLKPIDSRAFVRAVRRRFQLSLYEAFSWGTGGLFRKDVPESMRISRIPVNEKKGQVGQCVFGKIILVILHHRVADTTHAVFTVSQGPYKAAADGGCKPPLHLPGRTCVTWVPGVDFEEVEAWWRGIVSRPCIQLPMPPSTTDPRQEGPAVRFVEEHFVPQNPFVAGSQLLQAALTPEYSELRDDLKILEPIQLSPEELEITDGDLLSSPVPSLGSSEEEIDFCALEQ